MTLDQILALPVHPAASVFPMLPEDELEELAADIKANGLQQPIVVKDGVLIDGRNRREACKRAGVRPKVSELNGADPVAFIISSNVNRRHLTKQQRLIGLAMIYPEPEQGRRTDLADTSSNLEQVHRGNLSRARLIVKWAPELASKVLKAGMPFDRAHEEAEKRRNESETHDSRVAALRSTDPDLADKVAEEQLTIDDAEGAAKSRRDRERRDREEQELILLETFRRAVGSLSAFSNEDFAKKARAFFEREPGRFLKQQEEQTEGLGDDDLTVSLRLGLIAIEALLQGEDDGKTK